MEQVRLRARVRLFPRANRPRSRRALARGRVGRRLLHRAMPGQGWNRVIEIFLADTVFLA